MTRTGLILSTRLFVAVLLLGAMPAIARAQEDLEALKQLSLQDLMAIDVTTVSRIPAPALEIPAAVHVITRNDIRRSGATSLPEALRLAPGVQVARIDAARHAVGIRGFGDRLARSMLVMIDGRAVYSPLFAGTYWETQHILLDDVDRIEVIRGPGGTIWGTNAVNGVINIITRSARETQRTVVTGTLGSRLGGPVAVRIGGEPRPGLFARAYARGVVRHAFGPTEGDDSQTIQIGGRMDWDGDGTNRLTLQGDLYRGWLDQGFSLPLDEAPYARTGTRVAPLSGGNVLTRWSRTRPDGDGMQVQAYYDRTARNEIPVAETRDTFDIDIQTIRSIGTRHRVVWGGAYRLTSGRIEAAAPTAITPNRRTDQLFSAFLEDEIVLVPNSLRATVGTKVEHNDYSGVELQPSARLLWNVDATNVVMASIARAVRTPSRVETDYTTMSLVDPAAPVFIRLLPNPDFVSEELIAYELGYRSRPHRSLYVTGGGFFNTLDHMLSTELERPPFVESEPAPRVIVPVIFRNGLMGNSYGGELTTDWRPATWWRLATDYSYVRIQLRNAPGGADVSQERRNERLTPRHHLSVRTSFDMPGSVEFDWMFRVVSALRQGSVPRYATSDVRVAWRFRPGLEVAVAGRDLHAASHMEWPEGGVPIRRRGYVSVTWRH